MKVYQLTKKHKNIVLLFVYLTAILLGIFSGFGNQVWLQEVGMIVSNVFIKVFKCLSLPLVGLSILVTLSSYHADLKLKNIGKKTLLFTLGTTLVSATITCILYQMIQPDLIQG